MKNEQTCKQKFISWLKRGDINYGSEEFLAKAREILITIRTQKNNEHRQENLRKELLDMKKCGKNNEGKIKLDDMAKKIKHFENILKLSFSIKSPDKKRYEGLGPII